MAAPRKKWSTTTDTVFARRNHPSQRATYRYVQDLVHDVAVAAPGQRLPAVVNVWVDEGAGRGWELFETIRLADLNQETPT